MYQKNIKSIYKLLILYIRLIENLSIVQIQAIVFHKKDVKYNYLFTNYETHIN